MYKRLAKSTIQESRSIFKTRNIRSKILFFVEGAETERIYLNELAKRIPVSKNLDIEIFDRWKDLSGESNQLKVVIKTKEYLSKCGNLGKKQRKKIQSTIDLLESKSLTIDDILERITALNKLLEYEILSTKEILLNQLLSIKTCYDFDESIDKICFVLDRDCGSFTANQFDQVLALCKECNYELGMSTPNFEFFLLLHLTDLKDINSKTIFENKNEFTLKKLKEILGNEHDLTFKKNKYDASLYFDNIDNFESNISNYTTDNLELKESIGSSLGSIVKELITV